MITLFLIIFSVLLVAILPILEASVIIVTLVIGAVIFELVIHGLI